MMPSQFLLLICLIRIQRHGPGCPIFIPHDQPKRKPVSISIHTEFTVLSSYRVSSSSRLRIRSAAKLHVIFTSASGFPWDQKTKRIVYLAAVFNPPRNIKRRLEMRPPPYSEASVRLCTIRLVRRRLRAEMMSMP